MLKLILKIIYKTLKVLSTVAVIVALIVVISQRVTNNKLRLFGYGVYTVISESMLPEYEVGDMFLAQEVKEEKELSVGQDIVYIGEVDSYKDKVITHRIIRIEADNTIVTKGINNDMEDPPIHFNQVYGKVTGRLIVLSLFSKLMNNNILFYIIIFVPFTILIFLDTKDLFEEKKNKEDKEELPKDSSEVSNTLPAQETVPVQATIPVQETVPVQATIPVQETVPVQATVPVQENTVVPSTTAVINEVKEESTENKE